MSRLNCDCSTRGRTDSARGVTVGVRVGGELGGVTVVARVGLGVTVTRGVERGGVTERGVSTRGDRITGDELRAERTALIASLRAARLSVRTAALGRDSARTDGARLADELPRLARPSRRESL